jgi:ABC-type glycerol-3-phosphate transport system permease component
VGRIAASGSLVLVPVLIFALLAQRYLVRGLSRRSQGLTAVIYPRRIA